MIKIEKTFKIYWRDKEDGVPNDILSDLHALARTNCETEWYEWFIVV